MIFVPNPLGLLDRLPAFAMPATDPPRLGGRPSTFGSWSNPSSSTVETLCGFAKPDESTGTISRSESTSGNSTGQIQEMASQERGKLCPGKLDLEPGTRGHGCPRSNLPRTSVQTPLLQALQDRVLFFFRRHGRLICLNPPRALYTRPLISLTLQTNREVSRRGQKRIMVARRFGMET